MPQTCAYPCPDGTLCERDTFNGSRLCPDCKLVEALERRAAGYVSPYLREEDIEALAREYGHES